MTRTVSRAAPRDDAPPAGRHRRAGVPPAPAPAPSPSGRPRGRPRHTRDLGGLLGTLGQRVVLPHRRGILLVALLLTLAGGYLGRDVVDHLSTGGFVDASSESARAAAVVDERFPARDANLILLVTARGGGGVDDPAVAEEGRRVTAAVQALPGVRGVSSYWSLGGPPALRSQDSRQGVVLANVPGDDDEVTRALEELSPRLGLGSEAVDVAVGGQGQVFRDIADRVEHDLRRAELLAFPLTGILLLLVFGTAVAAALPLAMGVVAVVGTVGVLLAVSSVAPVSVFALNLATGLGLGLAIDYALFMLSRYREERRTCRDADEALVRTMATAGRAVTFSGLTVGASLLALLVFPLDFLRSFAYAGIAVSVLAVLGAVLVLPALLAVLGDRVESLPVLPRLRRPGGRRTWGRLAERTMRRPVLYLAGGVAVLVALGLPFLDVRLALPDDRVLPVTAPSRLVQDGLRAGFPDLGRDPVQVVLADDGGTSALERYAAGLSALPDVRRVESVAGVHVDGRLVQPPGPASAASAAGAGRLVTVDPAVEAMSPEAEELVRRVRAEPAPSPALVGGRSAELVDVKAALFDRLPLALGLIAASTFVALLVLFGAVLVPVKALVLNTLSLSATFGLMVWVFQDGRLSGVLGYTPTGTVDATIPVLMFCMAFGLSMDYEVFIMSRIKEAYDEGRDSDRAVVEGLASTGSIVTTLAVILATVFVCFATSGVTFIKLMGLGLATAVLVDATLVRGVLVPVVMRLSGRANWWAPAWLRRAHDTWGPRSI